MSQVTTERVKNTKGGLGAPVREYAERADVDLVHWQIVPQSAHALVVIEYEEVGE